MNEPLLTDRERMQKFLEYLPELAISDLLVSISNAEYYGYHEKLMNAYFVFLETIESRFADKTIHKRWVEFNKAFKRIYDFTGDHFVLVRENFLVLRPEDKHGSKPRFILGNKRVSWKDLLKHIKKLSFEAEKKYKELVKLFFIPKVSKRPLYKKGVLYFAGKEIVFLEKRSQNDYDDLLRVIFSNKNKRWSNDEIDTKLHNQDRKSRLKYYQAGNTINKTIASETGIADFLIINTKYIEINKKYL